MVLSPAMRCDARPGALGVAARRRPGAGVRVKMVAFLIGLGLSAAAAPVMAHGDVQCPSHPKNEWRPHTELVAKLEKAGWTVRRVEATETCYEVYAKDPQGRRREVFFDPKTHEEVVDG